MMDMVERAAEAASAECLRELYDMDAHRKEARAGILAALTLNDTEMARLVRAVFHTDVTGVRSNIQATALHVRALIEALKTMAREDMYE